MVKTKLLNTLTLLVILIMLFASFSTLFSYLYKPDISVAYFYIYYIIYIFLPFNLIALVLFNSSKWENRKFKKFTIILLLVNIVSTFLTHFFLKSDANKVQMKFKNLSNKTIDKIEIVARNQQFLVMNNLENGQSQTIFCDCRDVDINSRDTLGMMIRYKIGDSIFSYNVFGASSNLFDQTLEFRIIKDSLVYRSYEISNDTLWSRVGGGSSLERWNDIK
jgi:hypothetical protein